MEKMEKCLRELVEEMREEKKERKQIIEEK